GPDLLGAGPRLREREHAAVALDPSPAEPGGGDLVDPPADARGGRVEAGADEPRDVSRRPDRGGGRVDRPRPAEGLPAGRQRAVAALGPRVGLLVRPRGGAGRGDPTRPAA